jgi:hypothetical protein
LNAPLVIHGKINGSAAPIDHDNIGPAVRRCGDAMGSTLRVLELEARLLTHPSIAVGADLRGSVLI